MMYSRYTNEIQRPQIQAILFLCIILLLGFLGGCGGGTQGTGGIAIEGRLLKTDGTGLPDTTVTVAQTGDSTTTDLNGSFSLTTTVVGDTSLLLENSTLSTEVAIGALSTNAASVRVTISVNEDDNSGAVDEIEIEERDDDREDGNGGSNSGSNDDDDDDDDSSSSESNDHDDDESEDNDDGSENEQEDDDGEDDYNDGNESSNSGNSGSNNGESENNESGNGNPISSCDDEDPTGPISEVSTSSITVGGITFIINTETRIEDANEDPISVGALNTGLLVRVQGECENESLIAERIRITE